jgi:molecular chaperone GrpE (heat shock protein)
LKKIVKKAEDQLPARQDNKNDLLAMGRNSFLYVQQLNQQVEELERQVAGYERIFQNLRQLFGREMDEMEEWILKVLQ